MADSIQVAFSVNGRARQLRVRSDQRLLDVLRDDLRLTGAKEGCGKGECGSCTVLVDGRAVDSCLTMAYQVDGSVVETIEGLCEGGRLHPIQDAFIEKGGVQCGICIPGMVMAAKALLDRTGAPLPEEIRQALAGSLCRCTGYAKIFAAVAHAAGAPAKSAVAEPPAPVAPSYYRPRSLEEALEILAQRQGEVRPIAGGTDVLVKAKDGQLDRGALFDLGAVPEMNGIEDKGDHVWIGATTTHAAMIESPLLATWAPALPEACRVIGGPQIRNRGTLGGNLANASPAADTVPPLYAADAVVETVSISSRREVPIAEFFTGPRESVLAGDELIVGVRVPKRRGVRSAFLRLGQRQAQAISKVSIAVAMTFKDGGPTREGRPGGRRPHRDPRPGNREGPGGRRLRGAREREAGRARRGPSHRRPALHPRIPPGDGGGPAGACRAADRRGLTGGHMGEARPRVLVVDDDESFGSMVCEVLGDKGYDATFRADPKVALEESLVAPFSVAVLDLQMPGLGGIELARRIRSASPDTQVIVLTAHADLDSAVEGLHEGIFDYLSKQSLRLARLEHSVQEAVARWQLLRENRDLVRRLTDTNRLLQGLLDVGSSRPGNSRGPGAGAPRVLRGGCGARRRRRCSGRPGGGFVIANAVGGGQAVRGAPAWRGSVVAETGRRWGALRPSSSPRAATSCGRRAPASCAACGTATSGAVVLGEAGGFSGDALRPSRSRRHAAGPSGTRSTTSARSLLHPHAPSWCRS
jgi:carbon-monoxide dehydrogenase small subunit/xanthine dehydrogenase small subunit